MTTERQALIDMVPLLQKLEDGACSSYPGEACCGTCETLGSTALDLALDGLAEYPGQTRWTSPPPPPDWLCGCGYYNNTVVCTKCGAGRNGSAA